MTFTMLDTAAQITPALVQHARAAGHYALALYGQPSAGWREVHAASDAEFLAASQMPGGVVLIHFGPDSAQAIAQADHLRSIGVNVVAIAVDKEWNDTSSYVAFCLAVRATGRYISVEYGTVAGDSADSNGAVSWWLAEPGWHGTPGSRYSVQNGQTTIDGVTFDVSVCADDFLQAAGARPDPAPAPTPIPPQEYDMANLVKHSAAVTIGGDGNGWFTLPAGTGNIVSVVVYDTSPQAAGRYVPIPAFSGVAWDKGQLVFGAGPNGKAPAGNYGFDFWTAA